MILDIQDYHLRFILLAVIFLACFFVDFPFFEISNLPIKKIWFRLLELGLGWGLFFFGGLAHNIFSDPMLEIKDVLLLKGAALWIGTSYMTFAFFLRFLVKAIWVTTLRK